MRTFVSSLLLVGSLLSLSLLAPAQSTPSAVEARLLHHPVFLRGFWRSDQLRFNESGRLRRPSERESFTLSGVEITRVTTAPHRLLLEGRRLGVRFHDDKPELVVLHVGGKAKKSEERVRIEIAAPANHDFGAALDRIFAPDLQAILPTLPFEWQNFARKRLALQPGQTFDQAHYAPPLPPGVEKMGPGLTRPKRLTQSSPVYNQYVKTDGISGEVAISVVLDREGRPTQPQILRAVGLGMDEAVATAAEQGRFTPATRDGKPVPVVLALATIMGTM